MGFFVLFFVSWGFLFGLVFGGFCLFVMRSKH